MDSIIKGGTEITFDKTTLRFSFQKEDGCRWRWDKSYMPYMECRSGNIFFHDAGEITHELLHTGVGEGILSTYCGFKKEGKIMPYKFQTLVWVEEATGDVYCEWIPLCEEGLEVKKVFWPGPMEFEEKKGSWYTLLIHQPGILIPNIWDVEF